MGFCYELDTGASGCLIRNTVCIALSHFMIHGLMLVSFVFSNNSYPPLYYVDYVCGGCGAALTVSSFLTAWTVDMKKCQCLRGLLALIVVLVVLATIAATFYYVVKRWDDVIITALTASFRSSVFRDLPDYLWYTISVTACLQTPVFLFYLIYILSFMCNPWQSHLFTTPYVNNRDVFVSALPPPLSIPPDTYSGKTYKPYPVQKLPQENN